MDFEDENVPVILIVDDVEMNIALLQQMIEKMGYVAKTAMNVDEAISEIRKEIPQLILLDIIMPEISGYQFCEMLKQDISTRDIPVVFVSAIDAIENKKRAFELGAVDFITKPYAFADVSLRVNLQLKINKMQKELEYSNRRLNLIVSEQANLIEQEQRRMLCAVSKFSGASKGLCNESHLENVSKNARLLAQGLNFTEKYENKISSAFVDTIEAAARMHDIGKLAVPDYLLKKQESLTDEEKAILRMHTKKGADIVREIYPEWNQNNFMKMTIEIIENHHEKWDGTGYPSGLAGEEIPLSARIISIANYYDKLINERCYKSAYSKKKAIEIINEQSGTRFDPCLVELFNKVEKQLKGKDEPKKE